MSGNLVAIKKWMCQICSDGCVKPWYAENGQELLKHLKDAHDIDRKDIEFRGHSEWYRKEVRTEGEII